MTSNLQLPYHITQTNDLTYKFITQSGVVYTAYFMDISESFGADHVYYFSFEAAGKPVKDGRVRDTIVKILSDFFSMNQNSLIIVCESIDKKEKARFRLFERWYQQTNSGEVDKVDMIETLEYFNLCSSLLLHKNHPFYQEMRNKYDEWIKEEIERTNS